MEQELQKFVDAAKRTEPNPDQYSDAWGRLGPSHIGGHSLQHFKMMRLLHAAMGMVTEAAEFLDMLKKHIFYGKPFDAINALEEIGDSTWYERIGVDALEVTYLQMLERNVAKLRARFPEKFAEDKAINRDLGAEKKILEGEKFTHQRCSSTSTSGLQCTYTEGHAGQHWHVRVR